MVVTIFLSQLPLHDTRYFLVGFQTQAWIQILLLVESSQGVLLVVAVGVLMELLVVEHLQVSHPLVVEILEHPILLVDHFLLLEQLLRVLHQIHCDLLELALRRLPRQLRSEQYLRW
jgi:hypothetical protein